MTFVRSNLLGWGFAESLTSAQMNSVDIDKSRAVDGFAGGSYSPSASLTWNAGLEVDAGSGPGTNVTGVEVTSKGNSDGVRVNPGDAAAVGIDAEGGSSAIGVIGRGGTGNAVGVNGRGAGTSEGIQGRGGATDGTGVTGIAHGSATNAIGVLGTGKGTLAGVKGIGIAGPGVLGTTSGTGYGVIAQGDPVPSAESASLRIVPQSTVPFILDDGAVWIQNDTNLMYTQVNSLIETFITNRAIQAPKVLGLIDAGNSFGSPVVRAGDLNITSAAYTASILRVTFTTALTGTDYFVLVNHDSSVPYHMQAINHTTTTVDIRRFDTAGAQVSFNIAQDIVVHVAIFSLGGIA